MKINIREAEKSDIPLILDLIYELAVYERLEHQVTRDENQLYKALFVEKSASAILLSYDNKIVGFALYFYNFSTFLLKKGLYLEDVFIKEPYRNLGIGKEVFRYLINKAKKTDCGRIEWSCLDWNENSLKFYEKIGAKPQDEWVTLRLVAEDFDKFPY